MATALLVIKGEDVRVDWEIVDVNLFHQINRVVDLEGGTDEHIVYFSASDWVDVKRWVVTSPSYINAYASFDSGNISVILNGRYLHLKHK
jgi:hypothetical protein